MRRQIIRIIINQKSDLAPLLSKPITPPTAKQSVMIRQIIASAMIDHVARKMTPLEARELEIPRGKVPYVTTALNSNTPAFIHRESFVAPLKASDVVGIHVITDKDCHFMYRRNIRIILYSKIWSKKEEGRRKERTNQDSIRLPLR